MTEFSRLLVCRHIVLGGSGELSNNGKYYLGLSV